MDKEKRKREKKGSRGQGGGPTTRPPTVWAPLPGSTARKNGARRGRDKRRTKEAERQAAAEAAAAKKAAGKEKADGDKSIDEGLQVGKGNGTNTAPESIDASGAADPATAAAEVAHVCVSVMGMLWKSCWGRSASRWMKGSSQR